MGDFNPRSHERSDIVRGQTMDDLKISIHAPTRGATRMIKIVGFIPIFQSTLPREERLSTASARLLLSTYFNPRSHERSDNNRTAHINRSIRFQSTLPREERLSYGLHFFCASKISIHAPTRGATSALGTLFLASSFQSTLPREERRLAR